MIEKDTIREQIWDRLETDGLARFPFPPHGRIPNFAGAGDAADRLANETIWSTANVVKSNPDAPQLPLRRRALRDGLLLYMAVPRLRDERCFLELDPTKIEDIEAAPTVSTVESVARPCYPDDLPKVDLIVLGSVAVTPTGARIGKGEGYSDLEYALLAESDRVDDCTTVATTVHDIQVLDRQFPVESHDVPLDLIVTPTRTIRTETEYTRPAGINWETISPERLESIPALARYS